MMLVVEVIPFITHLFIDQSKKAAIRNCLITCQCGSLFFMAQEIAQIIGNRKRYFKDIVNWNDFTLHPLLWWYII